MRASIRSFPRRHLHLLAALAAALMAQPSIVLAADTLAPGDPPAAKFAIGPIIGSLLSSLASSALQTTMAAQAAPIGAYPQPAGSAQYPQAAYNQAGYSAQGYQQAPAYLAAPAQAYPSQGGAPCYFAQSDSGLGRQLLNQLAQAGCQAVASAFVPPSQPVAQYVTPIMQPLAAQPELSYGNSGTPNYQGVKVTVIMTDPAGRIVGERPLGSAFHSGERFRLKIQPTFSGLLEIDHFAPSGLRSQLFPKPGMSGFMVAAGSEVTLPLGDAVYEFDAERGNERLVFRVRDPGISSPSQYGGAMMAQDVGQSTFLGQSVTGNGQLPYISQSVDIQHR